MSWSKDAFADLMADDKPSDSLESMFTEIPVSLDVFVTDSKYLGNPPLSNIQADLVKHVERIYYPSMYPRLAEHEPYWSQSIRTTNIHTVMWGKGSGKDSTVRISALRVAYLLLCMRNPQDYFGMPWQDTIHMLNIASNSGQALSAFFTPMTRAVKRGWFADRAEAKSGKRSEPKADRIIFANNVEAISGHSDADSQEGLNLILGVADEIDAFRTKVEIDRYRGRAARESPRSADAVIKMLRGSGDTRFPVTFKNVYISYPRYLGSTIMQQLDLARRDIEVNGDDSIYYASGPFATWEVNPRVPSRDAFADAYDKDPDGAAARYECKPTRAVDTYFKNPMAFAAAVDRPEQPVSVDYALRVQDSALGHAVSSWDAVFSFADDFVPIEGAIYALHFDLALVGDRAGIALSHVVKWEDTTKYQEGPDGSLSAMQVRLPVVRNDFVIGLEADPVAPAREIQIRWGRELALELIRRGFTLGLVSYDGFQSADSLQILTTWGITCGKLSTDKDETIWRTLRDVAYDGRLSMAYSGLFQVEIESLGRFGGKVDHPDPGSKDLADAVACSVAAAVALGGQEASDGAQAHPGSQSFELSGVAALPGMPEDPLGGWA